MTFPPQRPDPQPKPAIAGDPYSYELAKTDPQTFRSRRSRYLEQYRQLIKDLFTLDPAGVLPLRAYQVF
ncbi:MAG TPA: hypothetical protein VNZ22_19105 [Bacillota bacterium]|nr:hypothetical protein [Bacillota bacterium]